MATKKSQSKTAFVLAQPASASAKEVSSKAKAAGLKISAAYVYAIRHKAKAGGGGVKRKPGRPKGSKNKSKAVASSDVALDRIMLGLVAEHGGAACAAAVNNAIGKLKALV